MKQKSTLLKILVSVLMLIIYVFMMHLVNGDLKNIHLGFKSLLHCGLVDPKGDIQSPIIEGTGKDYWVFRVGQRNRYWFLYNSLTMQKLALIEKQLKKIENNLHPENSLKDHDPKKPLSNEQLQDVIQALESPENIHNNQLLPAEQALSNFETYAGRCYTLKRGLLDFSQEETLIRFGTKTSQ